MALKNVEKKIGTHLYRQELLGTQTGQEVFLVLAGPFAALFKGAVAGHGLAGLDFEGAVKSLSREDLKMVTAAFAEKTRVQLPDGAKVRWWPLSTLYDEHFSGEYTALLAWLRWSIEINGFFEGVLEKLRGLEGASASDSPPASTGFSGDSSSPTD